MQRLSRHSAVHLQRRQPGQKRHQTEHDDEGVGYEVERVRRRQDAERIDSRIQPRHQREGVRGGASGSAARGGCRSPWSECRPIGRARRCSARHRATRRTGRPRVAGGISEAVREFEERPSLAEVRRARGGRGAISGPGTLRGDRGAARLGRGAPSGGVWGAISGPPMYSVLAPRLHPGLRPRQARARRVAVAALLRPRQAGGDAAVHLYLRRARGEEGAEDADGAIAGARRHG